MNFMESVTTCFQKYFVFSGRARRSEYWWWVLFSIIGSIVFSVVDLIVFGGLAAQGISPLNLVFSLVTVIPTFAVATRRLHDIGKSGWFQFLPALAAPIMIIGFALQFSGGLSAMGAIITIIGVLAILGLAILLIVWYATDGHRTDNRYGYSPKYGGQVDAFD